MPMVRVPRLTIGIPTYDRPERLITAISSALSQHDPAIVLVADQTGKAADTVKPYLANPYIRYINTGDRASCLWENWTAAVEACDTEFFAWLQDDDEVAPHLSSRVTRAFDMFPNAPLYLARLGISTLEGLANWWQATGPMVPMDLKRGLPSLFPGKLIAAGGYFSSFALSPAVAFRCDLAAVDAVRRCPLDCDLYNERIVLAEIAGNRDVICDPAIVGYWNQHDGNESKQQVRKGGRTAQFPRMVERLDAQLAAMPGWQDTLRAWLMMVGVGVMRHWLEEAADYSTESPIYAEARSIVEAACSQFSNIEPPRVVEPEQATSRKARRAERAVSRR
jgi:hypothetical protein